MQFPATYRVLHFWWSCVLPCQTYEPYGLFFCISQIKRAIHKEEAGRQKEGGGKRNGCFWQVRPANFLGSNVITVRSRTLDRGQKYEILQRKCSGGIGDSRNPWERHSDKTSRSRSTIITRWNSNVGFDFYATVREPPIHKLEWWWWWKVVAVRAGHLWSVSVNLVPCAAMWSVDNVDTVDSPLPPAPPAHHHSYTRTRRSDKSTHVFLFN